MSTPSSAFGQPSNAGQARPPRAGAGASPRAAGSRPCGAQARSRLPLLMACFLAAISSGALFHVISATEAEQATPLPVAIVLKLSGAAEASLPGADEPTPVELLDWFPQGTELATLEGASLELAFRSGARWRLGSSSAARLAVEGPEETRGPVERLPDLAQAPAPAAAHPDQVAGAALTAVRIRGQGFSVLYPDGGARTVAGATRLYFQPELPFDRYRVGVEDEDGRLLLDLETKESLVEVPPGVLEPGATYYWTVRTRDALGHLIWEEARFETLPPELEAGRQALLRYPEAQAPPAMVAAMDQELGLWWEAREALVEAIRQDPRDERLGAALRRLEGLLGWAEREAAREP
jgi:hypothetical protein